MINNNIYDKKGYMLVFICGCLFGILYTFIIIMICPLNKQIVYTSLLISCTILPLFLYILGYFVYCINNYTIISKKKLKQLKENKKWKKEMKYYY